MFPRDTEDLIRAARCLSGFAWHQSAPMFRPYQGKGIAKIAECRHGTILDESGLGKRMQVIIGLKIRHAQSPNALPVLILCRHGWETYWQNEWRQWAGTGSLIMDSDKYDSWPVDLASNRNLEAVICADRHLARMLSFGNTKKEANDYQAGSMPNMRIRVFDALIEDLSAGPLLTGAEEMMRRLTRAVSYHYELIKKGTYARDPKQEDVYRTREDVKDQVPAVQLCPWPVWRGGPLDPSRNRESQRGVIDYFEDVEKRASPHIVLYRGSEWMEVMRNEITSDTLLIRAGDSEEAKAHALCLCHDHNQILFWHIDNPPTQSHLTTIEDRGRCKFTSLLPADKTEAALQNWGRITCTVFV